MIISDQTSWKKSLSQSAKFSQGKKCPKLLRKKFRGKFRFAPSKKGLEVQIKFYIIP